jgi:tetratricopeptide (TPR) repeat protein
METGTQPGAEPLDEGLEAALKSIRETLARSDFEAASVACEALVPAYADEPALLRLRSQVAEGLGNHDMALEHARRAVTLRPRNVRARLRLIRCLWRSGATAEALEQANRIANSAARRSGALLRVGDFFEEVGLDDKAYQCRLRALELQPDAAITLAAVADSAAALGHGRQAEKLYDRALFHEPDEVLWLERRSRLRNRQASGQRAAELGFLLDRRDRDDPRRAPIAYALARELEALGHATPAFGIYSEGARCRRLAMQSEVRADSRELLAAATVFDAGWLETLTNSSRGEAGSEHIFITGLAGNGSAWLAARLAQLPDVAVLPRSGCLHHAIGRLAASSPEGADRWQHASRIDPENLAMAYDRAIRPLTGGARYSIDLSPDHLGILGLIRAAFPAATILHLRRDPVDHCVELFTTLFPRGHGWSYALDSLAHHYAAYHQLMGHWRRNLPGGLQDLDLERCLENPGAVLAALSQKLDLNQASIGQEAASGDGPGREPHAPVIGRWKRFEQDLAPLVERLRADGVPVSV